MAQDGPAQVAQAGHRPGSPPEPHMAVSGSVTRGYDECYGCMMCCTQTKKGCIYLYITINYLNAQLSVEQLID